MIYTRMLLRYLRHCEEYWAARTAALMRAPHQRQRRPATGSRHVAERGHHV